MNVGGHMTVDDQGDIHVTSTEDLSITADTQEGVVNVHSDQGLDLDNTANAAGGTGNMVIQEATAGGSATVNVTGDITGLTETDADGNETTTDSTVTAGQDASVTAGGEITDLNVIADKDNDGSGSATVTAAENISNTDVTAGQDASVTAGGDVSNTNVTAGDTASVTADGEIRSDGDTLVQGDNVELHADADNNGSGSVGTAEDPIHVDTASGNTGSGSLSATGAEVYVEEETGDLALKEITATEGDAEITAHGSITDVNPVDAIQDAADAQQAASDAQNLADAAADKADVLDKQAAKLEEEAQQARDEADAAAAEAAQAAADASAKDADATVAEAAAIHAEQDAQDVRDDIDLVDQQIQIIQNNTSLTDAEKEALIQPLEVQKEALEETLKEKEQAAQEAKNAAVELRNEADEAADKATELNDVATTKDAEATAKEADAAAARTDANNAAADAAAAQAAADAAQNAAEAAVHAADSSDPTVETAGDLTIHAGGSIGTSDNPLDTDVGGDLIVGASGDIAIANQGDLNIKDLNADDNAAEDRDVTLTASGNLTSDTVITGENAEINTLHGDVGSDGKPLELDVDHLSGTITGDAEIVNHGDLTVDDLAVSGDLDLTVKGDLKGGDAAPGTANITAATADITTDGNIGESGDPLETAVDTISAYGAEVDVHSVHDVTIDEITGEDIHIGVDGEIYTGNSDMVIDSSFPPSNINGNNLTIDTTGGIASDDDPLYVYISGELHVNSLTEVPSDPYFVINLYGKIKPAPPGPDGHDGNLNEETLKKIRYENRKASGSLVFRGDWTGAPWWGGELFLDGDGADGMILFGDTWKLILQDATSSSIADGRILGIFALNDAETGLTDELRFLMLTEEYRQAILALGFRWIVYRVGDSVLLIDLTALEETGEYIFALDPSGGSEYAPVTMWYEEKEILRFNGKEISGEQAAHLRESILLCSASDISSTEIGTTYEKIAAFIADMA